MCFFSCTPERKKGSGVVSKDGLFDIQQLWWDFCSSWGHVALVYIAWLFAAVWSYERYISLFVLVSYFKTQEQTSYFKDVSSHICFDTQQDELIQVLHDVLERVSLCWSLFVKNQVHFYKSQIFFSFYLKAWKYIKGFTKVELISIQYILSRTER